MYALFHDTLIALHTSYMPFICVRETAISSNGVVGLFSSVQSV